MLTGSHVAVPEAVDEYDLEADAVARCERVAVCVRLGVGEGVPLCVRERVRACEPVTDAVPVAELV